MFNVSVYRWSNYCLMSNVGHSYCTLLTVYILHIIFTIKIQRKNGMKAQKSKDDYTSTQFEDALT